MIGAAADYPEPLPLEAAYRVERTCDRFEAEWRSGGRPDISAYLDLVRGRAHGAGAGAGRHRRALAPLRRRMAWPRRLPGGATG